jgi:hypothetical protein
MSQVDPVIGSRLRLALALCLGVISIAAGALLVLGDGLDADVRWNHHAGVSAAPLLLVAGAMAAMSVVHPPQWRHALTRLVAIIAFTTWGLAQLLPSSGAAGWLDDAAILLFVIDAGCLVIADARTHLLARRAAVVETGLGSDQLPCAESATTTATRPCCVQSTVLCACASSRDA